MSEIPFDNMYGILKHLPVKSLLRFRCLSKAYRSLIDSRDFINLHLSQSKTTNTNRVLITAQTNLEQPVWDDENENKKSYAMNLDCPDHQLVEFNHPLSVISGSLNQNSYYDDHLRNPVIFGSCNGLIALYHPDQGVLLWNPSTKKQQKLPNFWGPDHKIHSSDNLLDGFGYDPVNDDYKLIRIRTANDEREKRSRAMVYSVKHDCSRRIQEFLYDANYNHKRDSGTLVGSCLHWIVSELDYYDNLIVALNLEDERFRAVPTPDLKHDNYWLIELGEIGGCLSMSMDDSRDLLVEIWIMKEYGVCESWSKIFSTYKPNLGLYDYLRSHVKPIGYSRTGDKILMGVNSGMLWEYMT
ncbi:F-box/kelch-repeat protein At3g06240-like [Mercurialis annua]|uniref:F-box/kelch-repeat protein At3g06240-like n=1 Tax=Mercurialis annua TaxID=3986 RepID=UPI00215E0C07|nr:F-box/kelch-repeat protein At3g06240-like [Mercurialis annua]